MSDGFIQWAQPALIKLAAAIPASFVAAFVGGIPLALWIFFLMQMLDIIAGMLVSGSESELASSISMDGMKKKLMAWVLIGVLALLQLDASGLLTLNAMAFGKEIALTPMEIGAWYFIITESISIAENASALGLPIPPVLLNALAVAKRKTGE